MPATVAGRAVRTGLAVVALAGATAACRSSGCERPRIELAPVSLRSRDEARRVQLVAVVRVDGRPVEGLPVEFFLGVRLGSVRTDAAGRAVYDLGARYADLDFEMRRRSEYSAEIRTLNTVGGVEYCDATARADWEYRAG